jgi:dihydroxyacetone kinase-like protein
VLRLYGNYGGDRMNFDLAGELLEADGVRTTTVLGTDDIASAGPEDMHKRRGVAGIIYSYKIAGAKAEVGASLDEVTAAAAKAVARCRTIGVALSPARSQARPSLPSRSGRTKSRWEWGSTGEAGIWRDTLRPADQIADEMLDRLLADPVEHSTKRVSVLVNSLGATH